MDESKSLEILKHAILLERRGKSFYQNVAEQTKNESVKSFFNFMAKEEEKHINILESQFKAYTKNGMFEPDSFDKDETSSIESHVLDGEIKEKISASGYEAAAIGAAISMEERAVKVYNERAKTATDSEEKNLYQWLVSWEQNHLNMLLNIDKALIQKVWFDNHFWPF
ncbi:MAG: ferritin family protein [Desulfobacterales bacterium]|nr:ferritin family protein [Desulfobacterales bacterium]